MSRIGVIGAGNIGIIISSHLIRAGHEVALVEAIKPRANRIRKYGVRITDYHEFEVSGNSYKTIFNDATDLLGFRPEAIFISTKASALKSVTKSLKKTSISDIHFISAQNGLDTEIYLSKRLRTGKVYRMVINFVGNEVSSKKSGPVTIRMGWLVGPNQIGALYPKYRKYGQDLAGLLSSSGLKSEYTDDFRKAVWEKAILNSALCPICALTYTTMGQAMGFKPSRELTKEVIMEGLKVSQADGCDFGENALKDFLAYLEKGGPHEPSMLIDVKYGRRTEIDWINGKIVQYAKKYNIQTPFNYVLTSLVRTIDEFKRSCLLK